MDLLLILRGWILPFRIIGRYPSRSIGSVRGIMIPIVLIIALLGIIHGLSEEMKQVTVLAGHSDYLLVVETGISAFSSSQVNKAAVNHIWNHTNVLDVLPQKVVKSQISKDGSSWVETELWGMNITHMIQFWEDVELTSLEVSNEVNNSVVVGSSLASRLGIVDIGFSTSINVKISDTDNQTENLEVLGILRTNRRYQMGLIVPEGTTEKLSEEISEFFSIIEIRVRNPLQARSTALELQEKLRSESIDCDVSIKGASQELVELAKRDIIRVFSFLVVFSLGIVLVQVYFSIHWLVERSERDIWILRVLGASRLDILSLFLSVALILGNLGLLGGITIGIFLLLAILSGISALLGGQTTITGIWPIDNFVSIVILTNAAIFVGSIYPSFKATQQKRDRQKQTAIESI